VDVNHRQFRRAAVYRGTGSAEDFDLADLIDGNGISQDDAGVKEIVQFLTVHEKEDLPFLGP
jgi:hypothetical protein